MGLDYIGNPNDYSGPLMSNPNSGQGTFGSDMKNLGPSTMYLLRALKDRIKNGSGGSVMADQRNSQAKQDQENMQQAMEAFSKLGPKQKQLVQLKAMQMNNQGAPTAMAQAPPDF